MTVAVSQGADAGGAPAQGQAPAAGVSLGTPAAAAGAAGAADQSGASGAGAGEGSAKPWYDGLVKDADNLKTIEAKKWDSPEAAIKSYRELETKMSQGVKSQAPADAKEYKFSVPKEMEANYNTEFADTFRAVAHKAGLSPEQAAAIHDGVLAYSSQSLTTQSAAAAKALDTKVIETKTDLENAWGNEQSPQFARNLEMSKRAISQLDPGMMDALKAAGIVTENGTITNAAIFKGLAKAGAQMFAEDTLYGAKSSNTNPFAKETEDMTAQAHLLKNKPEQAKLLIRASGREAMWAHVLNPQG